MLENIERLYDEIHGPKVTPYELLENVKLPNYISVEFSKGSKNNIIAYTECLLDDGKIAVFTYVFDEYNKLLSLTSLVNGIKDEIFNRNVEIEKLYLVTSQSLKPISKVV